MQAETERYRAETDLRRVDREREPERSFERRRVQREREFEIAVAQRERELERGFSQCEKELETLRAQHEEINTQREEELERRLSEREKEIERSFGLKVAKVEGELGSVKKELLTEQAKSARTVVELSEAQKQCQGLGANIEQLTSARGGLERALKGAMERLLKADQELAGIRKHRDTLLETLSRVVVDEEEIRTLYKHLQSYDTPACMLQLTMQLCPTITILWPLHQARVLQRRPTPQTMVNQAIQQTHVHQSFGRKARLRCHCRGCASCRWYSQVCAQNTSHSFRPCAPSGTNP